MGGFWSAYWHGGYIYGTEIPRGLDVLELLPSEYLTENEIAAAASVALPPSTRSSRSNGGRGPSWRAPTWTGPNETTRCPPAAAEPAGRRPQGREPK